MKHLAAVEKAVVESTLDSGARHGPLIELCRVLAAQMDAAGAEPSTRLTASYLSALKDLSRAITANPPRAGTTLPDRIRADRAQPAPSKKTGRGA